MEKNTVGFGPHLIADLSGCNLNTLRNLDIHFEFLSYLPEIIGMTKITQPYVFRYEGLVPEDKGITGSVIIAESHISIHSFEEKGHCFIDIFSCKPFDVELAKRNIEAIFEPEHVEYNLVERGKRFHHTC